MTEAGWKTMEEDASDPEVAVLRRGRIRLAHGDQEFLLMLEPHIDGNGSITSVRVALRRGGGAFAGPGRTYPAVGSIYESLMVTVTSPARNLQSLGPTERGQIRQAAHTVLDRAGRRLLDRRH